MLLRLLTLWDILMYSGNFYTIHGRVTTVAAVYFPNTRQISARQTSPTTTRMLIAMRCFGGEVPEKIPKFVWLQKNGDLAKKNLLSRDYNDYIFIYDIYIYYDLLESKIFIATGYLTLLRRFVFEVWLSFFRTHVTHQLTTPEGEVSALVTTMARTAFGSVLGGYLQETSVLMRCQLCFTSVPWNVFKDCEDVGNQVYWSDM